LPTEISCLLLPVKSRFLPPAFENKIIPSVDFFESYWIAFKDRLGALTLQVPIFSRKFNMAPSSVAQVFSKYSQLISIAWWRHTRARLNRSSWDASNAFSEEVSGLR
jgi:hypothetical protein